MSNQSTNWELRLKDLVLGPMKKLMDMASATQNKITGVQGGLNKLTQMSKTMGNDFKRNYSQLDNLLDNLKRRQSEAFNVKHIQAYQRMIDKTRAEMERLTKVTEPSKWQQFKSGFSQGLSNIPGLGGVMGLATNPYAVAMASSVALGVATTKLALNFETGMAKINATAQLPEQTLGKLKDRLVDIGSNSGGNFELMPGAYEKILSQTNKVNLSLDILETAVKGAKAGFTDIDTVAGALAQTLSVVGEQNTTANEVMDTLLKAKAVGAGEFGDFAQYLPQLIAAGNNLHIGFKDVAGLFSYMTAKGQSAADAAMLLQNAFTALQKKEIIKGLGDKGIQLFDAKGMRRNITDVFSDLTKKLSGLSDKKKTQFLIDIGLNDAQARNAFSILTSEGDKFRSIMGDVNSALGETDRQLKATENTARNWADIGDKIKGWGVAIGDTLLPYVDWIVTKLDQAAQGWKDILDLMYFGRTDKEFLNIRKQQQGISAQTHADEAFQKRYGFSFIKNDRPTTSAQDAFYYKYYNTLLNSMGKNKIVAEDNKSSFGKGKTGAIIETANSGDSESSKASEKSKISGDGSSHGGSRNLTQNLYITINVKKTMEDDFEKLKRKITDTIVDAGRDGLVTIGA